jgi:hypothetical protein
MGSAAAMTDCELLQVDKKAMMDALHREHAFSDMFVPYLLSRNIRYEEDLVDQLFNSSKKRQARASDSCAAGQPNYSQWCGRLSKARLSSPSRIAKCRTEELNGSFTK